MLMHEENECHYLILAHNNSLAPYMQWKVIV